jgi:hypothetical protein
MSQTLCHAVHRRDRVQEGAGGTDVFFETVGAAGFHHYILASWFEGREDFFEAAEGVGEEEHGRDMGVRG